MNIHKLIKAAKEIKERYEAVQRRTKFLQNLEAYEPYLDWRYDMYIVKAKFYSERDCFGESYVITSDNGLPDTRLEVGTKVRVVDPKIDPTCQTIEKLREEAEECLRTTAPADPYRSWAYGILHALKALETIPA